MEVCEITTSTASKPLTLEATQEQSGSTQQQEEGKFIFSPADFSAHRKIGCVEIRQENLRQISSPLF